MKIPLIALILQGIPEEIAVITLASVIANVKLEWKKVFIAGVFLAFFTYLVRLLPISFGIHTILLIAVLFLYLFKYSKASINTALVASILSYLAIIVYETLCLSILMPLFDVNSKALFENTAVRILMTLPQVGLLFLTAYILNKFKMYRRKD